MALFSSFNDPSSQIPSLPDPPATAISLSSTARSSFSPFHLLDTSEPLSSAQARFLASHPAYTQTSSLETLHQKEFTRLRNSPTCRAYLDYTGAGLYPESLVREHLELLQKHVFGNPHSANPSSQLSAGYAEEARASLLQFFDADPSEYDVVFTANASAALKLIGESYPFDAGMSKIDPTSPMDATINESSSERPDTRPPCARLILPIDAHNSVNGLREFALQAGAEVDYVQMDLNHDANPRSRSTSQSRSRLTTAVPPGQPIEKCFCSSAAPEPSSSHSLHSTPANVSSLFVMTGQSNVTGRKADLSLLPRAKELGYDTLLDAAALAPTSRISLAPVPVPLSPSSGCGAEDCLKAEKSIGGEARKVHPIDAMVVSLYKMIGYPTGVGALIARRAFLAKLRKRWFSGGSVLIVQTPGTARLLLDDHERWEDGTLDFLSLSAIHSGLQLLQAHLPALTIRLPLLMHFTLSCLSSLRHSNGLPVVNIHSPSPADYNPQRHGALISLSILTHRGTKLPPYVVEREASERGIHVRAGCMCNPGGASELLGLEDVLAGFEIAGDKKYNHAGSSGERGVDSFETVQQTYSMNPEMERYIHEEGVVRISFGLASSLTDASCFVDFVRSTFCDQEVDSMLATGASCAKGKHLKRAMTVAANSDINVVVVDATTGRGSSKDVLYADAHQHCPPDLIATRLGGEHARKDSLINKKVDSNTRLGTTLGIEVSRDFEPAVEGNGRGVESEGRVGSRTRVKLWRKLLC